MYLNSDFLTILARRDITNVRLLLTGEKVQYIHKTDIGMRVVEFYRDIMRWTWHMYHQ